MSLSQRAERGSDPSPPSPWVLAQAWVHLLVQAGVMLLPQAGVTTVGTLLVVGGGLLSTIVGVAAVVTAATRQTALGSVQQQLRVQAGRGASKQGCSVRLCSGRLLATASAGCPASVLCTNPCTSPHLHAAAIVKPYCLHTHTPFQCLNRGALL